MRQTKSKDIATACTKTLEANLSRNRHEIFINSKLRLSISQRLNLYEKREKIGMENSSMKANKFMVFLQWTE